MSLIVDLFAGGGGASLGIRYATGRDPDVAINHDPIAVSVHAANHPATRHLRGNVWAYAPRDVVGACPVDLLWASPTCTHFSKAKGGPLDRREATKIRALAWVVTRWAREVRPRVILLENVEAFADWGPLLNDGRPCPVRKGLTFRRWVKSLRDAGYAVEWRELRACDYGAPTSRKRLFVIARCDGKPIVWPAPTHGRGLLPYRTAASCIDWSIPAPSIFERQRPLSEATLRRIARGIRRFVLESAEPFVVDDLAATLIHQSNGERPGQAPRVYDIRQPLGTVVAGGVKHALVTAFIARHYGGHGTSGASVTAPLNTITTRDHHALVTVAVESHESDRCLLGTDPTRCDRGSSGRNRLEATKPQRDEPSGASTNRDAIQAWIPARSREPRREGVSHVGSPLGLDRPSGRDPSGVGAESQGRQQDKQSPGQPRTRDAVGELGACVSNRTPCDVRLSCRDGVAGRGPSTRRCDVRGDRANPRRFADDGVPSGAGSGAARSAKQQLVREFLSKYVANASTQLALALGPDDLGLVTINGEVYAIRDIGMRMLTPRELARAQGFPDAYVLDPVVNGKRLGPTGQVRLIGNSVPPHLAAALVRANVIGGAEEVAA